MVMISNKIEEPKINLDHYITLTRREYDNLKQENQKLKGL